mmetsp:Transcript_64563/g.78959  ORF Transcript_64563/g.78959 Transcript_64563/m.78959 type:complete len:107 (+) Transcript_64563:298-618(+)
MKGHTEAIQIKYDPNVLSYYELAKDFLQKYGYSVGGGMQYRKGIWYINESQKKDIDTIFDELKEKYGKEPTIHCDEMKVFYIAEQYHQKYSLPLYKKKHEFQGIYY